MKNPVFFEVYPKLREHNQENLEGALEQSVKTPLTSETKYKKLVIGVWQLNLGWGPTLHKEHV